MVDFPYNISMNQKKRWSKKEIDLLKEVYNEGKLSDVAVKYFPDRTTYSVRNYAVRIGLKKSSSDGLNRRYKANISLFDNWTQESAYILGVIAADGCVRITPKSSVLAFCIGAKDKEWLELIANILGDYPVKNYTSYHRQIKKEYTTSQLRIFNKKLVQKVINLGIPEKKSLILNFPDVSKNMLHHFVRGYFDGDGSAYLKTSRSGNKHLKISFLGTKQFLLRLQKIFRDVGYSFSYLRPENNHWVLTLSNSSEIHKIINWMYQDAKIFLKRKRLKCLANTRPVN